MEVLLNVTFKDFPHICRACLQFDHLVPFVDFTITETFKRITDIELEDDKLPGNVCINCKKQLEDISTFVNNCKNSDRYLRKILLAEQQRDTCLNDEKPQCINLKDEDVFDDVDDAPSPAQDKEDLDIKTEHDVKKNSDKHVSKNPKNRKNANKYRKTKKKKPDHEKSAKKRIEECSCNICGKRFTRRGGLKRHAKIHLGLKPFECETCGKTFVEKGTLNRHYLTHTGEKPFECNLCGKAATRKDQILEHISKHHPSAVNCDFVITEHQRKEVDPSELTEIKNKIKPKEQQDKHEEINYNNQGNSEADFELSEDQSQGEVRQFKTKKRIEICLCNLCGKVFRRRGYLKNHMAIHAKIKPFLCKICGKGFTQRHALTRHNLVHTKERPFQCNLCGKTFTRKEILMEHLKNHEEGMKPYLCYHCGKCFSNKDYLSKHLKYYMPGKGKKINNKKCICPHCGKQLHSVSYLKTHLLTHTGEKPFECKICGNKFTVRRSLNHHLNIHKGIKPYQCTQCEKAFRTSSSLRKHIALHTGERPFKCTSCEKGFIRRSHLKRHLGTH